MANKINNAVKFFMINANILLSFIGLFLFGFAFYLWFANWGELDPSFFVGIGVILALFGLCLAIISCIGCQGINTQIIKFPASTLLTGRRITFLHLVVMVLVLFGEIYLLQLSLSTNLKYNDVYNEMIANPTVYPPYAKFERFIAEKFNKFFFGAGSQCSSTLYFWFWDWVAGNCPEVMHETHCLGCHSYSYTFCPADANSCFDNSQEEYLNNTCPYNLCRTGILSYVHDRIKIFAIVLLAVTILQVVFVFFDLMIICFHPRDNLQTILYKSGTLAKKADPARSNV